MLIGRSAERERIDALLRSACDGRGGGLVVRGEAGIGKTSLLDYACERAEGMRVLRARGVETEAQIPFSGLYDLLRPALSFAEEIPPRQAAALKGAFGIDDEPPVESRLLIGAGTLSLLATAAETQPVLCVIDDAHWLDVASADTLAFAVRRMDEDSVAVLFTTLDEEAFEPAGISQLVLAPLELDEAVELLHAAGIPRQVAEELYAKATGNPLALLELQEALAEPERTGQEPLPEPLRLPEKIKTAFARRILELPDETRLALAVAAADSSGELTLIARACTALGTDAAALEPAEDAGLVTLADARVHFRHPLIRAAAWGSISEREQRSVHGGLAAALETPATS